MKDHDISFLELVQKSLESVPEYDIHQVKSKIENKENFYLVDVREDSEWIEGNIPNSIHIWIISLGVTSNIFANSSKLENSTT